MIKLVGRLNPLHIQFNAKARPVRHSDMTVLNLERFLCQALAILPDPVRVECGDPARGCGADMGEHSE